MDTVAQEQEVPKTAVVDDKRTIEEATKEELENLVAKLLRISLPSQITRNMLMRVVLKQHASLMQQLRLINQAHTELFCSNPDHPSFDKMPQEMRDDLMKERNRRLLTLDKNVYRTARK